MAFFLVPRGIDRIVTGRENMGDTEIGIPMSEPSFVGYIGDPDFHDGAVTAIEQQDTTVRVGIHGASGKSFVVEFGGVRALRQIAPWACCFTL